MQFYLKYNFFLFYGRWRGFLNPGLLRVTHLTKNIEYNNFRDQVRVILDIDDFRLLVDIKNPLGLRKDVLVEPYLFGSDASVCVARNTVMGGKGDMSC